jgi:nucleoside recognition membrane protein YjiH
VTLDLHEQRRSRNGVTYSQAMSRRRAPDLTERLVALVLAGGLVASLLLAVALTLGLVWLITVIVADLARRLGL